MIVSTPPIVLALYSTTLVISPSTVVLLALILPSRKFRDNNSASAAASGGSNGEDNMVKLPYLVLSLLPTVIAMSPPGWNMGTVSGGRVHSDSGGQV